ncbi:MULTISPECIES: hypothetical protein [Bacillus]|uniref:hypothetical protein n=1 Tax=Bacillus TaxID=1386 RepID=UPI000ABF95CE|nr:MULTISPECIES: hypothetical protein [Bacillus amyloliquefaciens group]MED0780912.1 hypothetical protein [Bacillus siamensis]MED0836153.1 hypothetical protein [Bacillus siamensis]
MSGKLTKYQLEEIRQRAEITTKGFWNANIHHEWPGNENLRYWVVTLEDGLAATVTKEDAEFIANAHQDIPALLNHINKLEKELEKKDEERKERNSVFIELLSEEVL